MDRLTIIVAAVERKPTQGVRLDAWLRGYHLGAFKTPFFSSARLLLEKGVDPATPFAMRWKGSDFDALVSTVGKAAALAVNHPDGKPATPPRLVPYVPWSGPEDATKEDTPPQPQAA